MNIPWNTGATPSDSSRDEQLREVLVFLFLITPSMGFSFFAIEAGAISFKLNAAATILRDLGLVALIVFFLWRNREPIRKIGWTGAHVWREAAAGVALFIPMFFATGLLEGLLKSAGFSAPASPARSLTPGGSGELALAAVLVTVVAIAEEIIFRGYLILRLQAVTGSAFAAAFLSSLVFSLGHGYEGSAGVITVGCMGLFFAFVYLARRSLVAPIVMHFLQDFIGIVLVPLLKGHG